MTTARRCVLALVLVGLVAIVAAAPAAATSTNTTVKGMVQGYGYFKACHHHYDHCFDTRLAGATVTVLGSNPLLQAITNKCGCYSFTGPLVQPPYQCGVPVQACATWYEPQTLYVRPNPGGTRTLNFCLLVKATTLTGTVLDTKHKAVSGAKVTVDHWATSTDSHGAFTLAGMRLKPQTKYTVAICAKGCQRATVRFLSAPGGSVSITVTLKKWH